jgi:hypothetical protein
MLKGQFAADCGGTTCSITRVSRARSGVDFVVSLGFSGPSTGRAEELGGRSYPIPWHKENRGCMARCVAYILASRPAVL